MKNIILARSLGMEAINGGAKVGFGWRWLEQTANSLGGTEFSQASTLRGS